MNRTQGTRKEQSGAALITVLMITVLLSIACIAILSAAGSNSINSTDVLSEAKAYWAAESGLQSTIRVLRGFTDTTPTDTSDDLDYTKASTPATSNYSGDPHTAASQARLSAWISYNYPTSGTPSRVVIGESPTTYDPATGVAYSVQVTDPDNSTARTEFSTFGFFHSGGTISTDGKKISYPDATSANRIEITFTDAPTTVYNFTGPYPSLGSFTMQTFGTGATIPSDGALEFRIDIRMSLPRAGVRSIWGAVRQASATAPKLLTFQSQVYELYESDIELCSTTSGGPNCPDVMFNLTASPTNRVIYAYMTPVEPYRLKVVSTGYGPNGARKRLEGIIQKNFFNGLASGAATTLIGPSAGFRFEPGTSNGITYSGGDCASATGCVPSFGLTNPTNLGYVETHPPGPAGGDPSQMTPPPALLDSNNIPEWQQSPAALDELIRQLRQAAQNSGRYFVNPSGNQENFNVGSTSNPPGSFANGTGITFCEGSCRIAADGGGVLVVTGKLTNGGDFDFRGMIIVTGEGGWERNGAGNGQVIGNVVIAPYNRIPYIPANHSTTFLPPQYYVTGGGTSDVIYDDVGATLNNTSSISDFMLGIAEK